MNAIQAAKIKAGEHFTGCDNASSYLQFANEHGYRFIETLDWSSSAGDWQFIISKDGSEWQILDQTNNWPKYGFSHSISDETFFGSAEEVLNQIVEMYE